MKYKIEISYEDSPSKEDFTLNVKSEFDDQSAKIVAEVLAHFYLKFTENKNARRYIDAGAKPKGDKS